MQSAPKPVTRGIVRRCRQHASTPPRTQELNLETFCLRIHLNAGLNFGDCFSYALAHALAEPLLFKGNELPQTDVECHPAGGEQLSIHE
jgi:hypothetical protein